jgi:hypothetical protein
MWQKLPDWIAVERDTPGIGKSWEGFRGGEGWAASELAGTRPVRDSELQLLVRSSDLHNTEHFPEIYPLRRWRGEKTVGDRRAFVVDLATETAKVGTHYFDAETGRLVRIETVLSLAAEGALPVTVDYSDFRTIDGVTLPFQTVMTNPALHVVTTIDSVEHNVEIDDAVFQPRRIE